MQILVHIARLSTGERKVVRISELAGVQDGEFIVNDVFVHRMAGIGDDGRVQGAFYATGHEPACLRRMTAKGHEVPSELFAARQLETGMEYTPAE